MVFAYTRVLKLKIAPANGILYKIKNKLNGNTKLLLYIHTYIISHYNLSVRIIVLVSHTTYVVCVNFMHKWRELQFKVDSERQVF